MKAFAEDLPPGSKLLRLGSQYWNDDGPYEVSLVVVIVKHGSKDVVMVKGLDKPLTYESGRALREWVRKNTSAQAIHFVRKKEQNKIYRTIHLKKKG